MNLSLRSLLPAAFLATSIACAAQTSAPLPPPKPLPPDPPASATPDQPAPAAAPADTTTPAVVFTQPATAQGGQSSSLPQTPASVNMGEQPLRGNVLHPGPDYIPNLQRKEHFGPFSAVAVQLKGGFAGAGIDIATPLAQRVNLRVGASLFQYSGDYDVDGISVSGQARFRSGTVQFDIFPMAGGFHISPGVTVYNGNSLNARTYVPGGHTFDLGDGTYISGDQGDNYANPIDGTAAITFGNHVAPSLTVGWGNMIPRSGRHWSVPFEIGVQYIGDPKFKLNLSGVACGTTAAGSGCSPIASDAEAQQDLLNEENDINADIRPLRFYPILSIGVSYAFHIGKH